MCKPNYITSHTHVHKMNWPTIVALARETGIAAGVAARGKRHADGKQRNKLTDY